jgi:hypothetical protein
MCQSFKANPQPQWYVIYLINHCVHICHMLKELRKIYIKWYYWNYPLVILNLTLCFMLKLWFIYYFDNDLVIGSFKECFCWWRLCNMPMFRSPPCALYSAFVGAFLGWWMYHVWYLLWKVHLYERTKSINCVNNYFLKHPAVNKRIIYFFIVLFTSFDLSQTRYLVKLRSFKFRLLKFVKFYTDAKRCLAQSMCYLPILLKNYFTQTHMSSRLFVTYCHVFLRIFVNMLFIYIDSLSMAPRALVYIKVLLLLLFTV